VRPGIGAAYAAAVRQEWESARNCALFPQVTPSGAVRAEFAGWVAEGTGLTSNLLCALTH